MEEKKTIGPHNLSWKNRSQGSVTGVLDVLSFDEDAVVLKTEQGTLTLKGKNLHVDMLSLETGELELQGTVESMVYSGSSPQKRGSRIKRLFR